MVSSTNADTDSDKGSDIYSDEHRYDLTHDLMHGHLHTVEMRDGEGSGDSDRMTCLRHNHLPRQKRRGTNYGMDTIT